MFLKKIITLVLFMSSTSIFTLAQEISVSIKPEKIRVGGALQITVSIQNDQIKNYSQFPEIDGFLKGGIMGFKRIIKCNPWGSHGHDPVPEKKNDAKN